MGYFTEYETKKPSRRMKADFKRDEKEKNYVGRSSKFKQYKEGLQEIMEGGCSEAETKLHVRPACNTVVPAADQKSIGRGRPLEPNSTLGFWDSGFFPG
jgi:hypothetical protein